MNQKVEVVFQKKENVVFKNEKYLGILKGKGGEEEEKKGISNLQLIFFN